MTHHRPLWPFDVPRPPPATAFDPRHAVLGKLRPSPALPAPSALTAQDAELAYGWRTANDVPPWATEDALDQYLPPYSKLDADLAAPPAPQEQNMTPQPQKTIRSLIDELKALKQRMQDEGAAGILQLLQDEVFSKYPEVKALAWTQYTPYYCDGESCEFGVNAYGTPRLRALSAAECDTIGLDFIVGEASPGPLDDIRTAVKNDATDAELMELIKCVKPSSSDEDGDDEDEFDARLCGLGRPSLLRLRAPELSPAGAAVLDDGLPRPARAHQHRPRRRAGEPGGLIMPQTREAQRKREHEAAIVKIMDPVLDGPAALIGTEPADRIRTYLNLMAEMLLPVVQRMDRIVDDYEGRLTAAHDRIDKLERDLANLHRDTIG